MKSRHGMIADDSERISFILPSQMKKSVKDMAEQQGIYPSTLLRRFVAKGLSSERAKSMHEDRGVQDPSD